jgi:hypothetical protein
MVTKREVQRDTLIQNRRVLEQLKQTLEVLKRYQEDPAYLRDAIGTTEGQISTLDDSITDLNARIKADGELDMGEA